MGKIYNTINLLLGARGTGKTVFVTGDKEIKQECLIDIYINKGMKVLILDTYDHPSYAGIKIIKPEQINNNWKRGVYRCFCLPDDFEELLGIVYNNFWNGAIIIEDAYKTQRGKTTRNLSRLIGDSKNKNIDIYLMFHTWKYVPKDLYTYLDYIELWKTKGMLTSREENELADNYPAVEFAYNQVQKNPNPYYHQTINVQQ